MLHCSCVSEAVPASSTGVGKPGLIAPASAAVPPAPMYLTSFAGVATDATFERSAASDKGPVAPPNLISNSKVSGSGDSRFNSIHNFIHSSSTRRNSRSSTRRLARSHGGEDFISSSHTADCMCAICGGSDGNALTSSSLSRHRRRHVSCRCRERATPRSSAACDKSPSNGSSSSRNSNEKLLHSIGQRHKRKQSATQQPPRRQDQEEDEEEGDEEEEEERKAALLRAKRERQRIASKNYRDRKRLLQLHAALAEVPPDALPFAFLALSRVAAVATAAAKAEGGAEGAPFLPAAPETSVQQQQLNASNAAATDVFSSTPRYADTCSCPCQPCTMHSVCLPQHQQSCTLHEQQRYRDWHVGQPLLLEQQPHLLRQQMLNRQQPLTMQEHHAWLQQWSRREREWQHFQDLSKVEQQQACQPELLLQQQWRLEPNKLHSMPPHMQALPPKNSLRTGKEASFKHVFQSSEEPLRRFSSGIFHYPRGSGDSSVAELNSLFPPTPTIPGPGVEAKSPPVVVSSGPAAGAVIADVAPSTTPSISEDARLLSSPSLAAGVANSASTPATLNQESAVVGASCFPPPWSTASQPTATSASAVQTSGAAAAANAAAGKGTGRTVAAGRKSIVSTVSATVGLTNSSRRAMMFGAGSKLLTQAAKKAAAAAAAVPSALSSFDAAGAAGTEAGSATSKRKDCSAKKEEEAAQANPLFGASLPLELYGDPLGLKNRCTITRNSSTERCMQWKRFKGIDIDLLKQYVRNRSSSNWGSSSLSSISHLRRHSCLMESVRKMLDATSSCSKFLSWRSSFFARSSGPSASEYMNRRGISNRDSDDSNTFNDNCAKSNSNSRRIRERESISLLGQRGRRGYCSSSKQCSAFTSFSHTNFSLHSSSRRITVASRRSFFHSECADDEEKSNITNHSNDSNTDNSNSSSYVMVSRDHSSSDTTSSTSLMGCSTTDDLIPVSPDLLRIPCSNCREEDINKRSYTSSTNSSTRENSRGNGRRHSRNSTNRSNSLAAGASTGSDANHVPLCVSSLSSSSNVYAMGLPCTALQSSRNSSALTQSCYPYSHWMETESPVTPNTSHVLQQIDALHCESTCQAEARPAPADFLQVMPAPAANTAVTAAMYPGLPVVHPAAAAEAAVAEPAATEIQAAVASTLLPSIVPPAAPSSLEETLGGKEAEGREAILISSSTSSSIASSDDNSNDHPQQQRAGLPISRAFAEERAGEGAATGPPTTLLQSITSLKQTCTFKPGDASASAAAAPTAAPRLSTVIAPTAGAEAASAGNTATAEGGGHGISETETAALASGPVAGEANAQQQQQRLYGGASNSQKENATASLLTPTSSAVSKECSDYAVDEPHLQQTDYAAFFASKAAVVNLLPDSAAALPAIAPPPVDVALLRDVALPPPAPHPLGAAAPVAALFPAAAVSATPDEAVDGKAVAAPIVASAPGFAAVPAATGFAAASVGSTAPAFAAGAAAASASAAPASAAVLAVATATAPPFVAVPAPAGAPPTAVSVGVMPACAAAGAGRRLVPCLDGDDASLNPLFTGTLEEEHEGEMSSADAAAAIMGELKGEEDTLEKYNERRSSIRGRGSSDAAAGSPFGVVVSRRRSNNTLRRSSAAAGARRRQPHQQKNVYSPSSYTSPSKQQQPSRLSGSSRDSFLFHSVRSSDEESVVYMLAGVDAEAQERRHSKTSTSSSNSNSSSTSTSISNSSTNGKWGGEGRKRDRRTSAADRGRSSRKQREGAGLASRNNSKRRNERERAIGGRAKACIGSGAAGDSNRRGGIAAAVARIYRQILSLYTPAGQKQAHALMWEMLGAAAADTNQQQLHGMQQQEEKPHTPGTGVPLSNVSVSEQLEQQQVHQQSLESRHHFTVQQQQLLQQQTALINSTVIHQQQQQLQISRQDLKGQQFDQQRLAQQQLQLHYPPAFLQMNESLPYQHQQLLQQHYREQQQQQQLHVEHQQQPANQHLRQRSYRIQDQWMYQHPLQQHRQEKRGGQEQQHFQLHRQQPGLRRQLHDGTGQGEQQELQGRSTPEQLHQEQLHKEQLYTQQQQLCGNKGRLEPYMGQQQYVSQQQLQHLFQQHLQQNWQLHYEQLSEQRSHQQPHQELCYYLQQQEGAQEQRYHTQTPRDCHEGFGGRLEQQEQQSGQQEKQEGNNLQDGQAECTEMQKQQMPTQQ